MTELLQHQGTMYFLSAVGFAAALFFGVMLRRNEARTEQRLKQARADITDMTILFQTMRDIIGQQKALAKDFNEELEHKMGQVKHILNLSMEKNKQLYEKQQRIVAELEEAQIKVDGLFRQLSHAGKATDVVAAPARPVERPAPAPIPPKPLEARPTESAPRATVTPRQPSSILVRSATPDVRDMPAATPRPTPRPENPMPPRPAPAPKALTQAEEAKLADTGVTKAPYSSWIAEDLVGFNSNPGGNGASAEAPRTAPAPRPAAATPRPAVPVDEEEPDLEVSGNGEAAREAFRALLNMPMGQDAPLAPVEMPGQTRAMAAAMRGNGGAPEEVQFSAPLQQRVLEYSEAGMTVAEVSRELGIGKGEVRLMLSLARQSQPGP
ncbi:MAG: hypothetical protein JNK74_19320 [Candidatus Hydrogenedentes bacterium]|nr:hypothetical protein [Candidatus Hydrogenedentota bacterium]